MALEIKDKVHEAPSKPFQYSEQAGELSPAEAHDSQSIFPYGDATVVMQPTVSAFDPPSRLLRSPQLASVLSFALLAMRADQFDSALSQPVSQCIAIGCLVVDQKAILRQIDDRTFDEPFDVPHFACSFAGAMMAPSGVWSASIRTRVVVPVPFRPVPTN